MKNVVILGSTGSIGESAIRVVRALPGRFRIVGLAVSGNVDRVLEQAAEFGVQDIAVCDSGQAQVCRERAPAGTRVRAGLEGVCELAALDSADVVLCAVVGVAGLQPVMAALEHGTDVALATKEVLVAAGSIVTKACETHGARLLPVDSEHSAIFQCFAGAGRVPEDSSKGLPSVRRLVLTASGGPFHGQPELDLSTVTVEQALAHPHWDMGSKVTVDSATLMNKGLEIMEACWLFGLPVSQVDVVVHPQSIVHSLVEYLDGSLVAQLTVPDMRFAIQYALTYPERCDGGLPRTALPTLGNLTFEEPALARFPCLGLARRAAQRGGTLPAVLNASNEVAVAAFLSGALPFPGIWHVVEDVMARHDVRDATTIDDVCDADAWARRIAQECIAGY